MHHTWIFVSENTSIMQSFRLFLRQCADLRRVQQSHILLLLRTAFHVIISFSVSFLLFFYFHLQGIMGCKKIDIERKEESKAKKGKLHELPYTELVKSGTIGLASDWYSVECWPQFLRNPSSLELYGWRSHEVLKFTRISQTYFLSHG